MKNKIDWNKWVAIWTMILAIVAIMGLLASIWVANNSKNISKELIKRTAPNQAELQLSLDSDNRNIADYEITRVRKIISGIYYNEYEHFDTYLINIGKGNIPWFGVNLADTKNEMELVYELEWGLIDYYSINNLDSFQSTAQSWGYYYKNCSISKYSWQYTEEGINKCKDLDLEEGLIEWSLKIRCPVCLNPEKYYIFYSCIGGQNDSICREQKEDWATSIEPILPEHKRFNELKELDYW